MLKLKQLRNDENGTVIGLVTISIVTCMIGAFAMFKSGEGFLVQENAEDVQALYVAESAINGIAYQLKTSSNWDSSIWSGVTTLNTPTGSAQLNSIVFSDSAGLATLNVTGTYDGHQRQLEVAVQISGGGSPNLPGAASFKAASPMMNGDIQVDGRNHDRDCNLIADGSGTYAMALEVSASDFNFTGSADLGSSHDDTDYGMAHTTTDRVLFDQTDLPETPDEVFDAPEGTLEQKAINNGAYYYNPGDGAFTVIDGVNYVEMPCGTTWRPSSINMDNDSSNAILVIHSIGADPDNPCSDSIYKAVGGGFFRGVLIVDLIDKLHGQVNGAIVGVGNGSGGGNLGNGHGEVCYSNQVLDDTAESSGLSEPSMNRLSWQENPL